MKNKIYVAGVWGFGNRSIMSLFDDDPEVEFLKYDFVYFHQFAKLWKFIKRKLGGCGTGILKSILRTPIIDRKYALSHCEFEKNENNYVVIFNSALLQYYSKEYFIRLKRKHNSIHLILYIIDPMPEGLWKEIEDTLEAFEYVLTIHPFNVKQFGFGYLPYIYAKPKVNSEGNTDACSDLFFCGVADEYRQRIINDIVYKSEENNVKISFFLKPNGNNYIQNPNVNYSEMSYEENIQRIYGTKCILEIMHEGYVGITQRYLEAIVYDKKLLTNNSEIRNLPYYDCGYFQYFENIQDINWDWVTSNEKVDYHYQNDFEPARWKQNLLCLVENK